MRGLIRRSALAAALAALAAGCAPSPRQVSAYWEEVASSSLVSAPRSTAFTPAVAAAPQGQGWLIGGVVLDPAGERGVAIWTSSGQAGPWTRSSMQAIAGRDGPNETIFDIAGAGARLVAFGYRRSPTEGYPRPSTWVSDQVTGATWREILEDREFFGGPDIVGFGDMAVGPHGYTIAGTWTDPQGHPVMAVWRSGDGSAWSRDSTDPSFEGLPGEIPFASGVADGPGGILLVGTIETPTPADPLRRRGGIWFSGSGGRWTRVPVARAGPSTTFDAVAAVGTGWVIAGTQHVHGRSRPAVWPVDQNLHVGVPANLPQPPGNPVEPTVTAAAGAVVLVAGPQGHRGVIWESRLVAGVPHGWKLVASPPDAPFPLTSVALAAGGSGVMMSLVGSDVSRLWVAEPAGGLAPRA
jgi:hypothetical protein